MKKIMLLVIALCFVGAGSLEVFSQKQPVAKKNVKRKLVKCKINGRIVYRTSCRIKKKAKPEMVIKSPVITERYGIKNSDDLPSDGAGSGTGSGTGQGSGLGNGRGTGNTERKETAVTESKVTPKPTNGTRTVVILSKPRAEYTDVAKKNQVQGTVSVRVTFKADGTIGDVSLVSGLPDGLSEQAAAAAKLIKFQPAMKNGVPFTTTRVVQYSFTLY